MNDAPSINVSDLRLGPVSREPLTELAPLSQYPEDEPNRASPDECTTVNSSATPVRRRGLVASHHPDGRAGNADPVHGSTPDNSTRDNTLRDDGRLTRLSDYLPRASPPGEVRETWTVGLIVPPENAIEAQRRPNRAWQYMNALLSEEATTSHNALNGDENGLWSGNNTENTRSNTPFDPSDPTGHQNAAHLTANGRIPNSDRPIVGSITDNVPESGGNPTYLTNYMEEPSAEERERRTRAFTTASVESNARSTVPLTSNQQDRASSAINRCVRHRNRRPPRTGGSSRRLNTEENEAFWNEFDDSGNS